MTVCDWNTGVPYSALRGLFTPSLRPPADPVQHAGGAVGGTDLPRDRGDGIAFPVDLPLLGLHDTNKRLSKRLTATNMALTAARATSSRYRLLLLADRILNS
ncbi:hypothetical protein [Methylocaldum sp. RMAD-M]|uniref:hypothetical protein n=1 Tax=unclassified Methylocaldum TaxID=2622260 RepID=UPI00111C93B0|nr:hypothetical protein [Methylocaldum sp. RMAD-M]MBP1148610.1 hypothetical protein [Methylocaldum sp. RMAD-M]